MTFLPTLLRWQDAVDILLVAFVVYRIFLLIRGTRAVQMLVGLAILVIAYAASEILEFFTLHWLLNAFLSSIILVIVVLFQNEIRRALARVGMTPLVGYRDPAKEQAPIEEILKAATSLANKKIGALIVLQRETQLRDHVDQGLHIDAEVSKELLESIFLPYSPMHDGAVIIRGPRLLWAGCFLPLSGRKDLEKELGTRHRAALGLSEETDAVILVVSEERGAVSLAVNGRITRDLDGASLRKVLLRLFPPRENGRRRAEPARDPGDGREASA
jgi:uncharacterized protein (TIGR00159 family)